MVERHGHRAGEPAGDVEEVEAWCRGCDAVRTFALQQVDLSDVELASSTVNVRRALEGEPAWVCGACGAVRFRLADEEAYDLAGANRRAILGNPPEAMPGGGIVQEDPLFKALAGDAVPHEPATEPMPLLDPNEADPVEDPDLEREVLREVLAQEQAEARAAPGDAPAGAPPAPRPHRPVGTLFVARPMSARTPWRTCSSGSCRRSGSCCPPTSRTRAR
ncbi:MAG: hypothetical protein LC624_07825 [Halobacteriales archaeon]|nr:hypothetical protein [Halobacteriales archaeon]